MKGWGCLLAFVSAIIGFFFWPLWVLMLVGIVLYVIGRQEESRVLAEASQRPTRKCPHCAELILAEATVCKHCGRDVPVDEAAIAEAQRRAKTPKCFHCGAELPPGFSNCPACGRWQMP